MAVIGSLENENLPSRGGSTVPFQWMNWSSSHPNCFPGWWWSYSNSNWDLKWPGTKNSKSFMCVKSENLIMQGRCYRAETGVGIASIWCLVGAWMVVWSCYVLVFKVPSYGAKCVNGVFVKMDRALA